MKLKKLIILFTSIIMILAMTGCKKPEAEMVNDQETTKEQETTTEQENEVETKAEVEPVKLTFFNTSAEVNNQFEQMFELYNEINPSVTIELIPTPIGGQQLEKFQALIASNTPATIANLDPGTIYQYKDFFLDLESEKAEYEAISQPGAVDGALLEGKFLGVPYTVQGYGLLYNTRVVEEALGSTFDPKTIKTRDDLAALLEKVAQTVTDPVLIHGANWSVGAHYIGLTYSLQTNSVDENRKFVDSLKDGSVDLSSNAQFQGLLDTFDLLKTYNIRKNDPLVADYANDAIDFASGNTAFYFMGDWIWSQIGTLEDIDQEFGFLPVPISNNPDEYGNSQIAVSEPKLIAIDNSNSTPEQQKAAKEFLKWMLTSEEGQKIMIGDMGFNLPYKDIKVESTNIPAIATSNYIKDGNVINIGVINYFPQDYWSKTGDSMLKYLSDVIDRDALTTEIEDYWKSVVDK